MHTNRDTRGTILLVVMITIFVIAGMSAGILTMATGSAKSADVQVAQLRAFQMAEAALDRARAELLAAAGANATTVATAVNSAGRLSDAVRWSAGAGGWTPQTSLLTWVAPGDDVGLDGIASTGDIGEGDGFPTPPAPETNQPGEPNVIVYRFGLPGPTGALDQTYFKLWAHWWGGDGIDQNGDGIVDTDPFESRTYTIRGAGVYGSAYAEIEMIVNRDVPPPPIDPNNPPGGFLAAISVQVAANSGAPSGNVNIFNPSAVNSVVGTDNATAITGATAPSTTNDTTGVMLAASGASLTLSANNPTGVTGTGGTPSFNNSGVFMGPQIDTIADGVKAVATDSGGLPSDNGINQSWGTPSSLKLVYHDFDQHGTLVVNNPGYGILVVDATTITDTPALQFTGRGSTWEGIVIVRVKSNLAPTGPNGAVKAAGSGSTAAQVGSVVIYAKQSANFGSGSVYKNNGNRPTMFSMGAIQSALSAFVTQTPPPPTNPTVSPTIAWRPIRGVGVPWSR